MQERFVPPELGFGASTPIIEADSLALHVQEVLSTKQRLAIIERDGGKCQATVPHQHSPDKYPLEVDHIIPQRYGSKLGLTEETLDQPNNLLSKCRNSHDLKHRDRISAREKYHESGGVSFSEMFKERGELLEHGEIYWDDSYDRTDTVRALQMTQRAKEKGWEYPEKKKKRLKSD